MKDKPDYMRTNVGRMLTTWRRVSVSIWILAIACVETVKNVETINAELENSDIPPNVTSRLWKRNDGAGIFSEHIKRWNYFKDTHRIWLWPNGVIPYVMGTGFTTPEKMLIWQIMQEFGKKSCVKFQTRRKERDYIEFERNDKDCLVFIGRLKGRNLVELDSGCLTRKTDLMHQLMHVLGFFDQHNTPDRDKWITIGWENIRPDKKSYFEISKARTIETQLPYDFNSLMHLGPDAFAKDSFHHTMWPLLRVEKIGPLSDQFNSPDLYKIDKLYADECKQRMKYQDNTRTGNDQDKKPAKKESTDNGKQDMPNGKKADQLTPHMICVFWPVTIGNSSIVKKVIKQRDTLDVLTDTRRIHLFSNYESYRQKCPPKGADVATR
ncbi:zinc metalloproteinase nas-6 [Nasonia vitripennis]|uniref:Metalloendopeptidase n=1 Tax=Nasonia vitripennis TaxID=7425 RepID=A0A7M7GMV1_NASVI|nr:zinc metalloproteinase nas-6 [Nasonia vitripennis]